MIESEINKRYCQSCGMPLRFDVEKYLGTNSDGSRSDEYCYYCLKDGKYIVDIPMSEMINIWIKYTDKYNEYADTAYSPEELRHILNERLPNLKRWKQKLETCNIHHQKIQDIIVYINNHLFDTLDTPTTFPHQKIASVPFLPCSSCPHSTILHYRALNFICIYIILLHYFQSVTCQSCHISYMKLIFFKSK